MNRPDPLSPADWIRAVDRAALAAASGRGTACGRAAGGPGAARIVYGMAGRNTLPAALARVSPRFATPVQASIATGVLLIVATWAYLLATSIQGAFDAVINASGLLFAAFYILTALAAVTYHRRRITASPRDAITLGILPVAAAVFLAWIIAESMRTAPAPQNWSLAGIVAAGLVLMAAARLVLRSPFFALPREHDPGPHR